MKTGAGEFRPMDGAPPAVAAWNAAPKPIGSIREEFGRRNTARQRAAMRNSENPRGDRGHDRVQTGGSLHDNFVRQVQELLDKSDISEEDRRTILANMSCPCCGGGAASVNIKLGD
ncbi:MAG: hypothetical protein OXH94_01305 [Rhodospirillales bacterium]|nr:hypothetical protein [Rhodospirillales bacterium]